MANLYSMLTLWAGVGILILGLSIFSNAVKSYGPQIKGVFERVGENKFKNFLLGAGITAILRTSSGTTLVIVGLISTGIMTLNQAAAAIVGANLGVAITNLLHSVAMLEIRFFFMGLIFIGAFLQLLSKNPKARKVAEFMVGFGLFFCGFHVMSAAFSDNPALVELLHGILLKVNHPLLLFLIGFLFVLIIQSSGTATAIFLMLQLHGAIVFADIVFLVLGAFLGTTGTMFIVSLPNGRDAVRAAMFHIYFNLFSSILFLLVFWPFGNTLIPLFETFIPAPVWQVTIFGLVRKTISCIIVFPFISILTKLVCFTIKDDWGKKKSQLKNQKNISQEKQGEKV